jgi:hypothetical protein
MPGLIVFLVSVQASQVLTLERGTKRSVVGFCGVVVHDAGTYGAESCGGGIGLLDPVVVF